MTKKQHYMTENERYKMEAWLEAGMSKSWIARQLGCCRKTIYNELKRGSYVHTRPYWDEVRYSAMKGQDVQKKNAKKKGRSFKVKSGAYLLLYIEQKILKEKRSPSAALAEARKDGLSVVSIGTIYNYISKRRFRSLTSANLWERLHRKLREKKNGPKVAHNQLPSIEQRPDYINQRTEYGHWEMDLVVSCSGKSAALLTFTERKSREEIILKVENKKAATIRQAIDRLERETPDFRQRFQSITTDNGGEFLEYEKLIESIDGGKRFDIYYCHSYAAWEKGTNENHNRMIRRFFPKGTDFTNITQERINEVQNWMNNYPRKILDWKTPNELKIA